MRKMFRILGLVVVPLFAFRMVDAARNINLSTGFYDSGNTPLRVLALAAVGVVVFLVFLRSRTAEDFMQHKLTNNPVGGLFFALSGLSVTLASAMQLVYALAQAPLRDFFRSKRTLYLAGYENTHFRIELLCAIVGLMAAVWFVYASVCYFKDASQLTKVPFFSCLPVVWYALRAVSDFSVSPVNPNNALIITYIAVDLILGVFYLRFARFISLGFQSRDARRLVPYAMLAFVFTVSFKAPLVTILPQNSVDLMLAAADGFTAAAAFIVTDITMKKKGAHSNEKPEMG